MITVWHLFFFNWLCNLVDISVENIVVCAWLGKGVVTQRRGVISSNKSEKVGKHCVRSSSIPATGVHCSRWRSVRLTTRSVGRATTPRCLGATWRQSSRRSGTSKATDSTAAEVQKNRLRVHRAETATPTILRWWCWRLLPAARPPSANSRGFQTRPRTFRFSAAVVCSCRCPPVPTSADTWMLLYSVFLKSHLLCKMYGFCNLGLLRNRASGWGAMVAGNWWSG